MRQIIPRETFAIAANIFVQAKGNFGLGTAAKFKVIEAIRRSVFHTRETFFFRPLNINLEKMFKSCTFTAKLTLKVTFWRESRVKSLWISDKTGLNSIPARTPPHKNVRKSAKIIPKLTRANREGLGDRFAQILCCYIQLYC